MKCMVAQCELRNYVIFHVGRTAAAARRTRWPVAASLRSATCHRKTVDAACCDVFELQDGKIKRFDWYPEGSIMFAQLGVLTNLGAALEH